MYILKVCTITIFTQLCSGNEIYTTLKIQEGSEIAKGVYDTYLDLFKQCLSTSMPNQRFIADNLHSYINSFSKTTVGYAPVFTDNRKFFANMINTGEFKTILQKDISVLQNNIVEKMRFCDESIMDRENLKLMYDREVDQTKQ